MSTAMTTDGQALEYRVVGPVGRTPILTVHGLVSSTEHWRAFTPHFATTRPVIGWDYRGHGGQPTPSDHRDLGVAAFASDAHAVVRAAGQGPAIVTGLSFGVQVALELYRAHRADVRALVLICGTAGHPLDRLSSAASLRTTITTVLRNLGATAALARPLLAFMRTSVGRRLARELAYASGGARRDACPREVLDDLFLHVGNLDPRLIAAVTASYLEHDAFDVLPTIDVPTLLIAGDRDELTPVATAERMRAAIPRGELVVFPGHSHLVQVEDPVGVHAAIDRFLAAHAL